MERLQKVTNLEGETDKIMEVVMDSYKCASCNNARCILSLNCQHCEICMKCFTKLIEEAEQHRENPKCPKCKKRVGKYVQIFVIQNNM